MKLKSKRISIQLPRGETALQMVFTLVALIPPTPPWVCDSGEAVLPPRFASGGLKIEPQLTVSEAAPKGMPAHLHARGDLCETYEGSVRLKSQETRRSCARFCVAPRTEYLIGNQEIAGWNPLALTTFRISRVQLVDSGRSGPCATGERGLRPTDAYTGRSYPARAPSDCSTPPAPRGGRSKCRDGLPALGRPRTTARCGIHAHAGSLP